MKFPGLTLGLVALSVVGFSSARADDVNTARNLFSTASPATDITLLMPFARDLNCVSYSTQIDVQPEAFTLQITQMNEDPLFDFSSTPHDYLQGMVNAELIAQSLTNSQTTAAAIFVSNEVDFSQAIRISNQDGKAQLIVETAQDATLLHFEDQLFDKSRTLLPAIVRADLPVSRYLVCQ